MRPAAGGRGTSVPKVAEARSANFEAAVRTALAELEADLECELSKSAVIARANVNRTTIYTRRKHDPSKYVHHDLLKDIDEAIERRASLLAKPFETAPSSAPSPPARGDTAAMTELANEAVRQRAAAESAVRSARNAARSKMEAEIQALIFSYALRSVWPLGISPPEVLARGLQDLSDRLRAAMPEEHEAALQMGRALAATFGSAEHPNPPPSSGPIRQLRTVT